LVLLTEQKLYEENRTRIQTDYFELKPCFLFVTQRERASMCLHLYWSYILGTKENLR